MLCELGEIDPFKLPPKRGKPEIPHTPGQERPHPEIVRGNTEMLGTAQQPPADNAPIMQRLNQLCMPKLIQTRPNPHIRRINFLGLNSHNPPNNLGHGPRPGPDKQLPPQIGPIERPQ
jgi:hypothetical protein